ncbi:MAG: hypothetical protein IPL52_01740 [Flavobacteriales bacterium]|nr:hypothetical protein [Flavobacteriales bacterium]
MRSSLLVILLACGFPLNAQWEFHGDTTVTWEQAIARYQDLDRAHAGARLMTIGKDDDGSPIHLFVISDGSGFTPDSIRAAGKNILWITNGIHPGEPDGIDASILLAQALLESDQLMGLTVHPAVCIVPIYNVWGAKQRQRLSRPDQNGPAVHGVRANARNLDLNRDFMKADASNTRALEAALAEWDPDVYFETHVSDGADHQYVMELLTTQKDKLSGGLSKFMTSRMMPELYEWMDSKQFLMCPYFETVKEIPEQGLVGFYDSPRYSTGYNALFDRIGILAESHMLKPYTDRVNATFQLMLATLAAMDRHADELARERVKAKDFSASMDEVGLNWRLDTTIVQQLPWKGYEAVHAASPVSGLPVLSYDQEKPASTKVPWMDTYRPAIVKQKPVGYLIPQAWSDIVDKLLAHGVQVTRLEAATAYNVEECTIAELKTGQQPSEGHYLHRDVMCTTIRRNHIAQAGDCYVRTGQVQDRFIMEALEPEGEDSYFAWGFFDAILQQKEWFNPYLFEPIAAGLLAGDPKLKAELDAKRTSDEAFAKDASAQLSFVFQRSPYADASYRRYPVLRVVGR